MTPFIGVKKKQDGPLLVISRVMNSSCRGYNSIYTGEINPRESYF